MSIPAIMKKIQPLIDDLSADDCAKLKRMVVDCIDDRLRHFHLQMYHEPQCAHHGKTGEEIKASEGLARCECLPF